MSYILDALRKSEAARRSREAPDLLAQTAAPLQPAAPARASRSDERLGQAMVALILWAMAVALWLPSSSETDGQTPMPARAADAARLSGGDPHSARGADDGMPPSRAREDSAAETARGLDPGQPPDAILGMAPVAIPAPATDVPPPAPAADARDGGTRSVSAAGGAMPAAPAPGSSPPIRTTAPLPAGAPVDPAASTSPAATAGPIAAGDGRPVALADIAPEQRRLLPPLRMSMHLWSEAPDRRLLVLDGQRLRQGDVLGEVVVERIDRDGAVLAWRGARILLPAE